jgi:murein DD-endopeptidase MepM/ murein hydrolase activator NlpD
VRDRTCAFLAWNVGDTAASKADLLAVFGSYVVLDHGHGEVSVFGHIQQHSAKLKVGTRVIAGQLSP